MKTGKTFFVDQPSYQQSCPRLAVTLGDPAGIGPEVVLKALADSDITADCELVIVGNRSLLQATHTQLQQNFCDNKALFAEPEKLSLLEVELEATVEKQITPGVGHAASGKASFAYLEKAITQTLAGEFDGIVTGPIAKSLWQAAGHNYPGQTEVLAKYSGVNRYGMLFVARSPHSNYQLRTLLATTHIPLRQVPDSLTAQLMASKLELLVDCLRDNFGLKTPRIAISGLNPHSGEQGQLGKEEQDWLIPWLEKERQKRPQLQLDGPVPPDTLWVTLGQVWYNPHQSNSYDAYLALYHDQGLIPVKLVAFDRAVNTTIGLPFVRTSPDHGTAFDIAGQGIADATSMKAAIRLAVELVSQRKKGIGM
ncbi:MAG: 4-hydroxythreonine-4-phosphate dehydrogenase PdxA [Symploca sp. SIO2E6]|nr:4-hydroxythreonine-4-phosphate dehydrogenase PdxA [Symploca sp. SIO2E6]